MKPHPASSFLTRFAARLALAALAAAAPGWALAWDATGHQLVAGTAERLLAGSNALRQANQVLGGLDLKMASIWADCAKGVTRDRDGRFKYTTQGKYPECAPLETPQEMAAMEDYVRRNHRNCEVLAGQEDCHKQYHYTDATIQREQYRAGLAGTSDHDIVGAIRAALQVLQGQAAPAPFALQGPREALLLLAHLVGDIHQPLHVGAIYLTPAGAPIDIDYAPFAPANDSIGGNALQVRGENLHHRWDDASRWRDRADALEAAARGVPPSTGALQDWPQQWASESLLNAKRAYHDVVFARRANDGSAERPLYYWPTSLPDGYAATMDGIKEQSLARAGARLAQLLRTLWP